MVVRRALLICGVFALAFSALAFGCAKKIPKSELEAAREVLDRARQIGAHELEEYKIAERYLRQAEEHLEKKEYDEARTKALISKEFAEMAIRKWNDMMETARNRENESKVEIVEAEPEVGVAALPPPHKIRGINPADVVGTSAFGRGYRLRTLENVYFDFDSFALREEMIEVVRRNSEVLKRILAENPEVAVLIEGHCDERGTNEYNLELGWKRAQTVRRFLVLSGIPEERIQTVSYGEEFPEEPCRPPLCQDESKWAKNRRAVFVITVRD